MQPNQKETSAMSLTMRIIIGVVVVLVCLVIYIYFAFHVTFNGQSRNGLQLWWFLCTNDEQNEIHSCSLIRPTKTADGRPMTKVPWTYFK
jgi:flagellar basal body-associated protein FliL